MRLIDADAFFEEFAEIRDYEYASQEYEVDAVEVVRCRDCEHYHENVWGGEIGLGKPYDDIIVGHHGCDRWKKNDGKDMAYTSPDGFCFLGERKE